MIVERISLHGLTHTPRYHAKRKTDILLKAPKMQQQLVFRKDTIIIRRSFQLPAVHAWHGCLHLTQWKWQSGLSCCEPPRISYQAVWCEFMNKDHTATMFRLRTGECEGGMPSVRVVWENMLKVNAESERGVWSQMHPHPSCSQAHRWWGTRGWREVGMSRDKGWARYK